MNSTLLDSLSGLLGFCTYFVAAIGFVVVFCMVYCKVTPYDELRLIRNGNSAAAISFGGALIGFILPLYSAITHSVGFMDMLIWAVIAMLVQFAVFGVVRMILKDLVREIENNHTAAATMLASCSISIGLLNAACMTY
jgi:putative membrane protein